MSPFDALRHLLYCRTKGVCCVAAYTEVRIAFSDLLGAVQDVLALTVDQLPPLNDDTINKHGDN